MMTGLTGICRNPECIGFNKELWMNPEWPIGDIESVMVSPVALANADLLAYLKRRQAAGVKYALIQMPNTGGVVRRGWRIQLYCQECRSLWDREVLNPLQPDGSTPDALGYRLDRYCEKCGEEMKTTREYLAESQALPCPNCGKDLEKRKWFVQDQLLRR